MAKISWITGCGPAIPSTALPVIASEGTVTCGSSASAAVEVTSRIVMIMCVSFICRYFDRRSFRWVQSHAHTKAATNPYNRPSGGGLESGEAVPFGALGCPRNARSEVDLKQGFGNLINTADQLNDLVLSRFSLLIVIAQIANAS
jgi:hypothetical protein